MNFKRIGILDTFLISDITKSWYLFNSNYTIGTLYFRKDILNYEYTIVDKTLIIKTKINGKINFFYPIGENVLNAMKMIESYCKKRNIEIRYCCLNYFMKKDIYSYYKDAVKGNTLMSIYNDYMCDIDRLIYLKKDFYKSFRNSKNLFIRKHKDYKIINLTKEDLLAFKDYKCFNNNFDFYKLIKCFNEASKCNFTFEGLVVDNKVVCIFVIERISDTIFIQDIRFMYGYSNAVYVLLHEIAKKYIVDGVKFIDFGPDYNNLLLKSKILRLKPNFYSEKYSAII